MFLPDIPTVVVDQFNGAITRLDSYAVPKSNGLYSQNVSYVRGQVNTRYGHSIVFAQTDGAITVLLNWVFADGGAPFSIVIYYAPAVGVRGWIQSINFFFDVILVPGAAGAVLVTAGKRLYAAFYDGSGRKGAAGGQVFGRGQGADPLFAAPLQNVPAVTETAPGLITAGLHRIGYLPTTRNGFTTNLSPVNAGGVFTPVEFTSTGSQNLRIFIPGPTPTYMQGSNFVQIVMTTFANPNRYFTVPGAISNLDNLAGVTIVISISDDDLAATGTDVTDNLTLLTCGSSLPPYNPPFNPTAIFTYSSRMAYCGADATGFPGIYFSDQDNYQHITADQHFIVLEGNTQPVQGFSMRGVCYIGTQFSFYSTEDNGDVPVTWTPPQKVDGSIGILSPTCIAVNQAAGYAGIASERGLYFFKGGLFPTLPISYYQQSDWSRIDWTKPTQVQVIDDRLNKRIIVQAPLLLGAGTSSTAPAGIYRMSWDYTEGETPETVKYSIDFFAAYAAGAVGVIQNLNNSLTEVWYAPSASGNVIRQNDGSEQTPYRDPPTSGVSAVAINSLYRTSNLPGAEDPVKVVNDYHGAKFRVSGNGNFNLQVLGVDGVRTTTPARSPIQLQLTPGKEELVKWFLRSEQSSIQFGTNGVDEFFAVSRIEAGYTNSMPQR